jgi:hypothetical protein
MVWIAESINKLFTVLLAPLGFFSPAWGLFAVSILTGIFMLLVFRFTSDQARIRATKNLIKAFILEIRLYKDSPSVIFRALGQIMRHNTVYLRHALFPLLIMFVPVALILVHLNSWYNYRPLRAGETFILKVKPAPEIDFRQITLTVPAGLVVETPALHISNPHPEVDWRLRVEKGGVYEVKVVFGVQIVAKKVNAAPGLQPLSFQRTTARFIPALLNPVESPMPANSPFQSIEVSYRQRENRILGMCMHWLVAFFILSLISALLLKKPLKVEF